MSKPKNACKEKAWDKDGLKVVYSRIFIFLDYNLALEFPISFDKQNMDFKAI